MSRPEHLWQLEWRDWRGAQERRYRKPLRCAEQIASVLAAANGGAPQEVVLVGLWKITGWDGRHDRLRWRELDPAQFLEECAVAADTEDADPDGMTLRDRYRALAALWREWNERSTA